MVSQSPNVLIYTIDDSGDKPVGPPQVIFTGFGGNNHDHGVHAGRLRARWPVLFQLRQ